MSVDTTYKSKSWVFRSKGIMARPATDRPPDAAYYLNMAGVLEREESALSTRFGNIIVNRDPAIVPGGNNYLLPYAPVILSRLRSLNSATFRYAALSNGDLYRRATDTQGPYTRIQSGLSGNRFTTLTNTCFASSQPYLFLYDSLLMLKDSGTGTPSRIGIFPPTFPVKSTMYAPQILTIDTFQSSSGYTTSGVSLVGISTAATVAGTSGTVIPYGPYDQYTDATLSYKPIPDGMLATSNTLGDGAIRLKFNTFPVNNTYNIVALNNAYSVTDSFKFQAVTFSIGSSSTGYIGKTVPLNLSAYQSEDLIAIAIQVSNPSAVQEIRVMFDVNGSGYSSSYYYKSLVPVSYQGSISTPQVNDPVSAVINEVFGRASGSVNLAQNGFRQHLPIDDPSINQVQPSQLSSGAGSWSVVYLRKGDFLPVGNAGQNGLDWSQITGWRVQITTTDQGSSNIGFNGLYIQGSPTATGVGTNAGPSSYGGIGYDIRYIYYSANTGTPSNPSWTQLYSVTQNNPGGVSTMIVLRQAINVQGQYSPDPQVTHVQVFVRGGILGENWLYTDQFPNVTGTGLFNYKFILPDSSRLQGDVLGLANDVPVTSTLQNPINTTLTVALNPTPANTNTPTLLTITTSATSKFVQNQVVVIGTPQNLEQVAVVTGGVGTFTAYIMLPHALGEQVQAFSIPGQQLTLAAVGYNQVYMAGDPNNPHFLYYTPVGYPENCPPQNYIPCPGGPGDPITAVINFKGSILVRTMSTWYSVFPGSPPYMQTTGSKHGSPASFDWSITESEIWFQGWDGIRTFRGADGPYRSLIIEWLFKNNPLTPIPLVNTNLLSNVTSTFKNNTATFVYTGQDGNQHRILYSTSYSRWRNDDLPVTAAYVESDTNLQLMSIPMTINGVSGWAIVYSTDTQDYDDGGWTIGGTLAKLPIPFTIQTPYFDQGEPNNQKQFNELTIDVNPNGQVLTIQLLFDDNNGEVAPITLGTITGPIRDKFQLPVNSGLGQQAYRASLVISGSVIAAPIVYQSDIHTALLAEQKNTYDSYWIKFGSDESKLVKQGWFDYTAVSAVAVQLFADGSTVPYYTFNLPANPARSQSPERVRFPAIQCRTWRIVMVSTGSTNATDNFQLWAEPQVDKKPILGSGGKGYSRSELHTGDMAG